MSLSSEMKSKFINLECELSPENISCDGECSKAEIKRKMAQINKEWKRLEIMAGRRVFHDEVDGWMMELN